MDPTRYPQEVVGEMLEAVVFVMDYVQFQFLSGVWSVMTPVRVEYGTAAAVSGEDQYRNRVCEQIGKVVQAVRVTTGEAITLKFQDGSKLLFSLRDEGYPGPEAVTFRARSGSWYVY